MRGERTSAKWLGWMLAAVVVIAGIVGVATFIGLLSTLNAAIKRLIGG